MSTLDDEKVQPSSDHFGSAELLALSAEFAWPVNPTTLHSLHSASKMIIHNPNHLLLQRALSAACVVLWKPGSNLPWVPLRQILRLETYQVRMIIKG